MGKGGEGVSAISIVDQCADMGKWFHLMPFLLFPHQPQHTKQADDGHMEGKRAAASMRPRLWLIVSASNDQSITSSESR